MTFTDLFPALKGQGRRRAADKVDELREENAKLLDRQAAADDYFALLRQDVADTNDALKQERGWRLEERQRRENAEKALAQAENVIRLRDQQIADLQRKVDVGVKAEHVIARTQEIPVEEIRQHCARSARVMTLQQAHCIGPVTDPGRTH
ncbi:hypothetical protein ACFC08_18030 [Streptomyces sp. NPDC056112]|uniref:hypothetical protein n=1 Tax=Streptomyces sp. NPDC056112 TaxID=3345715 RepID=UPI0035D709B1